MQYRTVQKEIECCCGCGDCARIGEQIVADEAADTRFHLRTVKGRRRFVPHGWKKTTCVQSADEAAEQIHKQRQDELEKFRRILDAMTWG